MTDRPDYTTTYRRPTDVPLAFVDTETTGLDPERHEIWEVGLILRQPDLAETVYEWQLPVDVGRADPIALNIGHFYERYTLDNEHPDLWKPTVREELLRSFAAEFARLTAGAHLVGAVVSFDAQRLDRLLRRYGACPTWHYHLVDVEALAAGRLRRPPPWKSDDLSDLVGVATDAYAKHEALGDAYWARDLYDATLREPS